MAYPVQTKIDTRVIEGNKSAIVEMDSLKTVPLSDEEIMEKVLSSLNTGDSVTMEKGVTYHESSDAAYGGANKTGEFGKGIRNAGDYKLEYLSIINKNSGKIIKVEYNEGKNIGDLINQTLVKYNLKLSETDIQVHIGGPVSGWINLEDITNQQIEENTDTKVVVKDSYKTVQNNFKDTVTITTKQGTKVNLKVTDQNGKIVKPGSKVIGSDGNEYRIQDIQVKQEADKTQTITSTVHEFSKENALKAGIIGLGIATALGAAYGEITKKENKEQITKEEYNSRKRQFEEAKTSYKKQSVWQKVNDKISNILNKFKKKEATRQGYYSNNTSHIDGLTVETTKDEIYSEAEKRSR